MSETTRHPAIAKSIGLKREADAIVRRKTFYAAGATLIPFPLIDLATLLGVQITMIRRIAEVYGQEHNYNYSTIRNWVVTLVGDLGAVGVMSGIKAIPVIGPIIGIFSAPVTGAAATYALGKVFTQHFDQGGTLLDFDTVSSRVQFHKEFEEGQKVVQNMKEEANPGQASAVPAEDPQDLESLKMQLSDGIEKLQDLIQRLESADTQ